MVTDHHKFITVQAEFKFKIWPLPYILPIATSFCFLEYYSASYT